MNELSISQDEPVLTIANDQVADVALVVDSLVVTVTVDALDVAVSA